MRGIVRVELCARLSAIADYCRGRLLSKDRASESGEHSEARSGQHVSEARQARARRDAKAITSRRSESKSRQHRQLISEHKDRPKSKQSAWPRSVSAVLAELRERDRQLSVRPTCEFDQARKVDRMRRSEQLEARVPTCESVGKRRVKVGRGDWFVGHAQRVFFASVA